MTKEDRVLVTIELDSDIYFAMLKHCAEKRISIDDFIEQALREQIKKHKTDKKKK